MEQFRSNETLKMEKCTQTREELNASQSIYMKSVGLKQMWNKYIRAVYSYFYFHWQFVFNN